MTDQPVTNIVDLLKIVFDTQKKLFELDLEQCKTVDDCKRLKEKYMGSDSFIDKMFKSMKEIK